MAGDAYDIDVDEYEGIPIAEIASEETFRVAVRAMNTWRENLRLGKGADGSHGSPFVNTGEAVDDITISPQQEGYFNYTVGGDVIQLAIAEFGRSPGEFPPPEPIARWMREQLGVRNPEPFPIQRHIAEEGIQGFAPARGAANEHRGELEARIQQRIDDLLDAFGPE